jgi:hypothetical protein
MVRELRVVSVATAAVCVAALTIAGATAKPAAPTSGQAAPAKPAQSQPAVTALTETGWPRDITSGTTKITIYQPQIDSYDGFRLTGLAAAAVAEKADAPPVYGILNLAAETHVDKDARLVTFDNMKVTPSFPGADEKAAQWRSIIQKHATKLRPITLERFEAALAVAEARGKSASIVVKNDPPIVRTSTTPAMLILVDGDPGYRHLKGTSLQRVINTRPLIVKEGSGKHWIKIFDGWMEAPALAGPYTVAGKACGDCEKALKAAVDEKVADLLIGGDSSDPKTAPSLKKQAPKLFVETSPAELLVFEGIPSSFPSRGQN